MRSPLPLLFAALGLTVFACGQPRQVDTPVQTTAAPKAKGSTPHAPPALRLPKTVVPKAYAVSMKMTPKDPAFSGTVDVDVELKEATDIVWIHAGDNLTPKTATFAGSGVVKQAKIERANEDLVGLALEAPLAAGTYKLAIAYDGKLATREGKGAYRQDDEGKWAIYTQFESISARTAFPCFDEPSFKTPWTLAIEAPKDEQVFANTSPTGETASADGWKKVTFAPTKPLPSYLVAFAVGPFDVVDAGKAGQNKTPVRIIVPKGRTAEAEYAVKTTVPIVEHLEKYFGIAYPYEKVDHIAVPAKRGAMENPGLITYGVNTMLGKPGEKSIKLERGYPGIASHELGHMWFGDYVTTAWWDDTWLNEGFASWISSKTMDAMHPEWDVKQHRVIAKSGAMVTDSLVSTRKIRQPIESKHDIYNAFDGITYQKGMSVIRMFESLVGEEPFRKAVHDYLSNHAHGSATASEFLSEIGASLKKQGNPHADAFAPGFSTFLDQPGFPVVGVELSCEKNAKAKLLLTQQRYLPLGSTATGEQTWQVPVCASYPEGKSCTVLSAPKGELVLDAAKACPTWVDANADAAGYYRVEYKGDHVAKLVTNTKRPIHERTGNLTDAFALARSGRLPTGTLLGWFGGIAKEGNQHLVGLTASYTAGLETNMVAPDSKAKYQRFVAKTFGDRAHQLGWKPKANDSDDVRLMRSAIVPLVARDAKDPLAVEARKLTEAWLGDRKAIDHDLVSAVLATAALHGDRALFDKLRAEAKKTTDRTQRTQMLSALGEFRDPKLLEEAFALAFDADLDPREALLPLHAAANDSATAEQAWTFVKASFDKIMTRLPKDSGASLTSVASTFCDGAHRQDVEQFFAPKIARSTGGPRTLAQVVEHISLCEATKAAQQPSVTKFLASF